MLPEIRRDSAALFDPMPKQRGAPHRLKYRAASISSNLPAYSERQVGANRCDICRGLRRRGYGTASPEGGRDPLTTAPASGSLCGIDDAWLPLTTAVAIAGTVC